MLRSFIEKEISFHMKCWNGSTMNRNWFVKAYAKYSHGWMPCILPVNERETVSCLNVFQEIGDPPSWIKEDLRVMGSSPQSASHQAFKVKGCPDLSNIPCLGFHFRYTTRMAASQCSYFGACKNWKEYELYTKLRFCFSQINQSSNQTSISRENIQIKNENIL